MMKSLQFDRHVLGAATHGRWLATRRLSPGGRGRDRIRAGVASPQIIEQVLVKVNGDIITKTELEERQIAALRQRNAQS